MRETHSTADQILDVARERFGEDGYDATSVAEIARRVGVVEGAIYRHFSSKRDLLHQVIRSFYEPLIESAAAGVAAIESPRERVRFLIRRQLEAMAHDPLLCRLDHQRGPIVRRLLRVRGGRAQPPVHVAVRRGVPRRRRAGAVPRRRSGRGGARHGLRQHRAPGLECASAATAASTWTPPPTSSCRWCCGGIDRPTDPVRADGSLDADSAEARDRGRAGSTRCRPRSSRRSRDDDEHPAIQPRHPQRDLPRQSGGDGRRTWPAITRSWPRRSTAAARSTGPATTSGAGCWCVSGSSCWSIPTHRSSSCRSPPAADTEFAVGAALVTGIGQIVGAPSA